MSKPVKHLGSSLYEFGVFRVDTQGCLLKRNGEIVPLKPKVFDTLLVLIERHGAVVSKDDLMDLLWPDTFVEENNLTSNISILRKILGEGSDGRTYIETIPKRGYTFVADVNEVIAEDADHSVEKRSGARLVLVQDDVRNLATDSDDPSKQSEFWQAWPAFVMAGVTVLAISAVLAYLLNPSKPKPFATDARVKSIAVLPFKALAAYTHTESLELGMAETLITKLGSIKQVNIRPINAVKKYLKSDIDPIAAGRELEVDYVLQGNLQMDGETVRATVHLWRVNDGTELYTDTCDRECSSILQFQDAVTQQITGKLALKLTGEEKQQLNKHYTDNTEAFLLYLNGRYYFAEQTREGYQKSIDLYQQAINIDPNYALAYAGLAQTYSFLRGNGLLPTIDTRQKQEEAAEQAVRLDKELAEAHLALAEVKSENWDWTGAEQEYRRAIDLNPGGADFHARYAHYLSFMGRIDEAESQSHRALELDPKSAVRYANLGGTISATGRYDQAIEWFKKAIEMRPQHAPFYTNLGVVYLDALRYDEAIKVLQKARALDDDPSRRGRFAFLAYAYAVSGRNDEARKMLAELKAKEKHTYIPQYNFAIIYHGLGDKDRTFDCLEKAYAERFPALSDIKNWGESDPFRADPRYADLLRRMNLAP